MRIKIVRYVIWFAFIVIGLDLVYVQLIRGQYFYRLSTHNRIRIVPVEGTRGRIIDRNGVVLADNRVAFDVLVTPQEIKEKDVLFAFLSQVLGVDRKKLLQRFHQKRYTPFAPVVVAEDISKQQSFILEENRFRFPSLLVQKNYRRNYPFNKTSSHLLGYVGKINREKVKKLKDYGYSSQSITGYTGIEEAYDIYLKGDRGGQQIEVNSQGQQVRLLGLKDAKRGKDVQLTIDSRIQAMASESLNGRAGAIVVLDVETGEVLGLVSSPEYDPNSFVTSGKHKEVTAALTDPSAPTLNRAIKGQYPPGSVFKVPVALGALSSGIITTKNEFQCKGYFPLGRRRIRCVHTHGMQNIIQGIAHSCNVYFINAGLEIKSEIISKYARMLGLGKLTKIDLPFEEKGRIPSKRQRRIKYSRPWYPGDTANLAIGQGDVLTTPIQLTRMMAIVSNSGNAVYPHLISRIDNKNVKKKYLQRKIKIDPKVMEIVKEGLHGVVHDLGGTAHVLNIEGLSISGKTGTAQSNPSKKHHAWFVGYNKEGKRKVAFCVFLEHGGSSYYATRTAKNLLVQMKKAEIL